MEIILNQITSRRDRTRSNIEKIRAELAGANELLGDKACVYATGSYGRLEAGEKSDLDLFIVGKAKESEEGNCGEVRKSQLARLDEICIKAKLIEATRKLNLPEFDGDGKYLVHYSVDDLTISLGKPNDDANNTLTGRLLLFLESQPLLGHNAYSSIISAVIEAYWRDYEGHEKDFVPAFLVNDILRLWRTFCVNYEANTQTTPDSKKLKRKVKNYKLKHCRMITCYSALLYLLVKYQKNNTVSMEDALDMTKLTPTQRLEWLLDEHTNRNVRNKINKLLRQYEKFLENTSQGDVALAEIFADSEKSSALMEESYKFGDMMSDVLHALGGNGKLLRLIVV